jgi:hypothetical protein
MEIVCSKCDEDFRVRVVREQTATKAGRKSTSPQVRWQDARRD